MNPPLTAFLSIDPARPNIDRTVIMPTPLKNPSLLPDSVWRSLVELKERRDRYSRMTTGDRSPDEWLQRNPLALESVRKGLEQAKEGRGYYLGSFAQYVDTPNAQSN